MTNCNQCKYYIEKHSWCNKWNNEKFWYQLDEGCFAFEINPYLLKVRSPKERKKEERRIKRLKKQGKIPLDYDEWRKATNQPFMTGLGNEDGYDDYLSEFYNDFGGV